MPSESAFEAPTFPCAAEMSGERGFVTEQKPPERVEKAQDLQDHDGGHKQHDKRDERADGSKRPFAPGEGNDDLARRFQHPGEPEGERHRNGDENEYLDQ